MRQVYQNTWKRARARKQFARIPGPDLDTRIKLLDVLDLNNRGDVIQIDITRREASVRLLLARNAFNTKLLKTHNETRTPAQFGFPSNNIREPTFDQNLDAILTLLPALRVQLRDLSSLPVFGEIEESLAAASRAFDGLVAEYDSIAREVRVAKWKYQLALRYEAATAEIR